MLNKLAKYCLDYAANDPEAPRLLLSLASILAAFFAPISDVLFAVGFLVIADLVTGIWASIRSGKKFQSYHLRRTIPKSVSYFLAIIAGYVVQTVLAKDAMPIVQVISALIGGAELLSIYENLSRISGVPFAKKLKQILHPDKEDKGS